MRMFTEVGYAAIGSSSSYVSSPDGDPSYWTLRPDSDFTDLSAEGSCTSSWPCSATDGLLMTTSSTWVLAFDMMAPRLRIQQDRHGAEKYSVEQGSPDFLTVEYLMS